MATHVIYISERRPGRYHVIFGTTELLAYTRLPLCESARELLRRGLATPEDVLETRRMGVPGCVSAHVKTAAAYTVSEAGRTKFIKFSTDPRWAGRGEPDE